MPEIMQEIMSRLFRQNTQKNVKRRIPNPEYEFRIVMREGMIREIMRHKGWRSYQDVGNGLGFTRQYICLIAHGHSVSAEFISRLGVAMGNLDTGWWLPFQIIARGLKDPNHPQWNHAKYEGKVPYDKFSTAVDLRKLDYKAESNL